MKASGQDLPVLAREVNAVRQAIAGLAHATEALHAAMLTGLPHDIADATLRLDEARLAAEPDLQLLAERIAEEGAMTLADIASHCRHLGCLDLALDIDDLLRQLHALARRSAAARRNAETLGRNLSGSVQMLRGLGVIRDAGLLAEA